MQTGQLVKRAELANPTDDPAIELEPVRIAPRRIESGTGQGEPAAATEGSDAPQALPRAGDAAWRFNEQNPHALFEAGRAIEMAKAFARLLEVRALLEAVKIGASKEGRAVATIAARWVEQVERAMSRMDPVRALLQEWRADIAEGTQPAWW